MIIDCQQIEKSYNREPVLNKVNLSVNGGELFGLVGMNGSGKSTLIRAILDLVSIDAGNIFIDGQSHRQVASRKDIAYLPDRFSPPAHLRCIDFIHYMLRLHGRDIDRRQIDEVLQGLELDNGIMHESVSRLSKGMTQKLGLATCLLSEKKLLILDEPMSGLDPRARMLFKKQLTGLKQKGVCVFFSSHMLADVEELADTMAVLHHGGIRFSGTPDGFRQAYQAESVEQAYMACIEKQVGSRQ